MALKEEKKVNIYFS